MEKKKLEVLFRTHYINMYRLARTILYDEDESRDVVSDVFARLVEKDVELDDRQMEAYLMTSVRNRCRDVLAHRTVRERFARLYSATAVLPTVDSADEERLDALLRFIDDALPPLTLRIFRLRFLREMSYQEVAAEVGVSKVTVYNHLSKALKMINRYFKNQ